MSVELLSTNKEFEQIVPHEVERKFIALYPEQLEHYKAEAYPLEQYYLSHPAEPYSLRLRESLKDDELRYEATLKDTGVVTEQGIDRIEVTTEVSPELYQYYKDDMTPVLRKLRAEPLPGIIIDFCEDGYIQVESEDEAAWSQFIHEHGDTFAEITGDHTASSEWRAHTNYRRDHAGIEALTPAADLDSSSIVRDILAAHTPGSSTQLHIRGRSGSGKSTIVREVVSQLNALGLTVNVLSTDDYHRGTRWLVDYNRGAPWTRWDDAIVYDTATMAEDLARLQTGESIYQRAIDWSVAEPYYIGTITPRDITIIEGIYAGSRDIDGPNDLHYELPTPLATCIGRRLIRDQSERPEFADPIKSLRYMLEQAEPAWRLQKEASL